MAAFCSRPRLWGHQDLSASITFGVCDNSSSNAFTTLSLFMLHEPPFLALSSWLCFSFAKQALVELCLLHQAFHPHYSHLMWLMAKRASILFIFTISFRGLLPVNQLTACQPHSLWREWWGLSRNGLISGRVEREGFNSVKSQYNSFSPHSLFVWYRLIFKEYDVLSSITSVRHECCLMHYP